MAPKPATATRIDEITHDAFVAMAKDIFPSKLATCDLMACLKRSYLCHGWISFHNLRTGMYYVVTQFAIFVLSDSIWQYPKLSFSFTSHNHKSGINVVHKVMGGHIR
eukprot:1229285-Amphidinium_carterae.1